MLVLAPADVARQLNLVRCRGDRVITCGNRSAGSRILSEGGSGNEASRVREEDQLREDHAAGGSAGGQPRTAQVVHALGFETPHAKWGTPPP